MKIIGGACNAAAAISEVEDEVNVISDAKCSRAEITGDRRVYKIGGRMRDRRKRRDE